MNVFPDLAILRLTVDNEQLQAELITADPKPARAPPGFEQYADPIPPHEWYGIDPPSYEE